MISVFVFMQQTYVTIIKTNYFPNKTDIALFTSPFFVSILASVQVTSSSAISSSIKSSNTFSSSLFNFFSCQLPWKGSVRFVFCYLLPVREEATERITTTTKKSFWVKVFMEWFLPIFVRVYKVFLFTNIYTSSSAMEVSFIVLICCFLWLLDNFCMHEFTYILLFIYNEYKYMNCVTFIYVKKIITYPITQMS